MMNKHEYNNSNLNVFLFFNVVSLWLYLIISTYITVSSINCVIVCSSQLISNWGVKNESFVTLKIFKFVIFCYLFIFMLLGNLLIDLYYKNYTCLNYLYSVLLFPLSSTILYWTFFIYWLFTHIPIEIYIYWKTKTIEGHKKGIENPL